MDYVREEDLVHTCTDCECEKAPNIGAPSALKVITFAVGGFAAVTGVVLTLSSGTTAPPAPPAPASEAPAAAPSGPISFQPTAGGTITVEDGSRVPNKFCWRTDYNRNGVTDQDEGWPKCPDKDLVATSGMPDKKKEEYKEQQKREQLGGCAAVDWEAIIKAKQVPVDLDGDGKINCESDLELGA